MEGGKLEKHRGRPLQTRENVFTRSSGEWETSWMSQWGRYIVSFDLADDPFQKIPIPDQTLRSWMNCHLAVLGGYVSADVPSRGGNGALDIWVMKGYGVQES
ncbi:F-box domain-containing protein [Forsythia ovata]|uniref:F-box domain-containing protein n=1 Tax=Forsythia ovata TaxID=205694 RepID=A0ABD1P377_9LAMI